MFYKILIVILLRDTVPGSNSSRDSKPFVDVQAQKLKQKTNKSLMFKLWAPTTTEESTERSEWFEGFTRANQLVEKWPPECDDPGSMP